MAYRKSLSQILSGVTRFGRLTVIGEAPHSVAASGFKARNALVRCDCGVEKVVRATCLRFGQTASCGCLQRELLGEASKVRAVTHGESRGRKPSPELRVWAGMKQRCLNPNYHSFSDYGGRGIQVCDRWRGKEGFAHFLADMGRRPDGHSIEREDNDGNYEPSNCRWATNKQQGNNRRSNVVLCARGQSKTVVQWAREIGVSPHLIYGRLSKGWTVEDALFRPKR